MTTWNDQEAEMVRQILDAEGIPCQVTSDVPHTVLPIMVDGLGEVRILVAENHLERAKALIAEYRRRGIVAADDGTAREDEPDPDRDDTPDGNDAES